MKVSHLLQIIPKNNQAFGHSVWNSNLIVAAINGILLIPFMEAAGDGELYQTTLVETQSTAASEVRDPVKPNEIYATPSPDTYAFNTPCEVFANAINQNYVAPGPSGGGGGTSWYINASYGKLLMNFDESVTINGLYFWDYYGHSPRDWTIRFYDSPNASGATLYENNFSIGEPVGISSKKIFLPFDETNAVRSVLLENTTLGSGFGIAELLFTGQSSAPPNTIGCGELDGSILGTTPIVDDQQLPEDPTPPPVFKADEVFATPSETSYEFGSPCNLFDNAPDQTYDAPNPSAGGGGTSWFISNEKGQIVFNFDYLVTINGLYLWDYYTHTPTGWRIRLYSERNASGTELLEDTFSIPENSVISTSDKHFIPLSETAGVGSILLENTNLSSWSGVGLSEVLFSGGSISGLGSIVCGNLGPTILGNPEETPPGTASYEDYEAALQQISGLQEEVNFLLATVADLESQLLLCENGGIPGVPSGSISIGHGSNLFRPSWQGLSVGSGTERIRISGNAVTLIDGTIVDVMSGSRGIKIGGGEGYGVSGGSSDKKIDGDEYIEIALDPSVTEEILYGVFNFRIDRDQYAHVKTTIYQDGIELMTRTRQIGPGTTGDQFDFGMPFDAIRFEARNLTSFGVHSSTLYLGTPE